MEKVKRQILLGGWDLGQSQWRRRVQLEPSSIERADVQCMAGQGENGAA